MKRRRFALSMVVLAILACAGFGVYLAWNRQEPDDAIRDREQVELNATVFVPTLDAPVPAGKSAVWCSTLPLAWKELRNLDSRPIRTPDPKASERLDRWDGSADDLPPDSYYVKAGLAEAGIVETIRREMAERFPKKTFPDLDILLASGPIAYAYLTAGVKYRYTFRQSRAIEFRDGSGKETKVSGFETISADSSEYARTMQEQIEVYIPPEKTNPSGRPKEFVVDPSKSTAPSQLLLAAVEWRGTLAATEARVEEILRQPVGPFEEGDVFEAPDLSLLAEHRFQELEGQDLALALQRIRFEMNRFGGELESEAMFAPSSSTRFFVFDRPFLVLLRKRGAARPYFVLWVENAELMWKVE